MTASRDATPGPIVEIVDVHQSFGSVDVLKGVSMRVAKGGVACIIGPSGSGKSTLLRCINGLVPIRSGSIRVATFDVHRLHTDAEKIALRKEVSMVFQQYNLFPHKTALENVMMAPIHVLKEDPRKCARARSPCSRRCASPRSVTRIPASFPVASSSASRSRARSRCGRR
jgi:ABC-type polar amino acid transport system ATPase subunit